MRADLLRRRRADAVGETSPSRPTAASPSSSTRRPRASGATRRTGRRSRRPTASASSSSARSTSRYSAAVNGGHDVMGGQRAAPDLAVRRGLHRDRLRRVPDHPQPERRPPRRVTITYYLERRAAPVVKALTVAANSRATVAVHDAGQVGRGKEVSAKVETSHPGGVVVERPIYFTYTARSTAATPSWATRRSRPRHAVDAPCPLAYTGRRGRALPRRRGRSCAPTGRG